MLNCIKFLFVFCLFLNVIHARALTNLEQLSLLSLNKTLEVKKTIEEQIQVRNLSLGEYIRFNILKKSCTPLSEMLKKIERENQVYPDQSKNIMTFYAACSEGVISLTHLYINKTYGLLEDDSTY